MVLYHCMNVSSCQFNTCDKLHVLGNNLYCHKYHFQNNSAILEIKVEYEHQ